MTEQKSMNFTTNSPEYPDPYRIFSLLKNKIKKRYPGTIPELIGEDPGLIGNDLR
jgi:hypothetical protein